MKPLANILGSVSLISSVLLLTAAPIQAGGINAPKEAPVVKTQADGGAGAGALCGKRDDIVKSLGAEFHERQQAVGVVDRNAILEIFVSTNGTWTIIATGTDGNSCLVASGDGWDSHTIFAGADV